MEKLQIKPPQLYWTSRATNFEKDIWFEKSPGCCGRIWFPHATWFMLKFPWLAVRVFWLMVKIHEAWNAFLINYPAPYPNLLGLRIDSGEHDG